MNIYISLLNKSLFVLYGFLCFFLGFGINKKNKNKNDYIILWISFFIFILATITGLLKY